MRTTLDLPDELMKQSKIAAVERGVTLRELMTEALRQALATKQRPARRVKLPNIRLAAGAPLRRMGIEELKNLEADDEAERLHAVYRGR
ncbi:MAG: hypothetical protein ACRETW_00425 [Stenotrophobium sp.]